MKTFLSRLWMIVMGVLLFSGFGVSAQCIVGGTNFDIGDWYLCDPELTDDNGPLGWLNTNLNTILNGQCGESPRHLSIDHAQHLPTGLLSNTMSTGGGELPFTTWAIAEYYIAPPRRTGSTAIFANPRVAFPHTANRPDNPMLVNVGAVQNVPFFTYTVSGLKPGSQATITAEVFNLYCNWSKTTSNFGGNTAYSGTSTGGVNGTIPTIRIGSAVTTTNEDNAAMIMRISNGTISAAIPFCESRTLSHTGTVDVNGNITFYIGRGNDTYRAPIGLDNVVVKGDPLPEPIFWGEACVKMPLVVNLKSSYPSGTTYSWSESVTGKTGTGSGFIFEPDAKDVDYKVTATIKMPEAGCTSVTSAVYIIKSKACCEDGLGNPLAKLTIFNDDFGHFPNDNTYQYRDQYGILQTLPIKGAFAKGSGTATTYEPIPFAWPQFVTQADLGMPLMNPTGDALYNAKCAVSFVQPYYPGVVKDHTSTDGRGGMLYFSIGAKGKSDVILYKKRVDDLCEGKKIYFNAWFAPINRGINADGYTTGGVEGGKVGDIVLDVLNAQNNAVLHTTNKVTVTGKAGWKPAGALDGSSAEFTMPAGVTSVFLQVRHIGWSQCGNNDVCDYAIDDILFQVCAPPNVLLDATAAGNVTMLNLCDGNDVTLKVAASDIITNYYANTGYLFQYTYNNPNSTAAVTWHDLGTIGDVSQCLIQDPPNHPVFSGLLNGQKVYFRAIVGDKTYLANNRTQWESMDALSPCRAISISTFNIEAALNCKRCTESKPVEISSSISAPVVGGIKTVNLCSGGSTTLNTNDIKPTPPAEPYSNYAITWYKGNKTTAVGTPVDPGTKANPLTVNYADATAAGVKYYVRVQDKEFPTSVSATCQKWDSILVISNPIPTVIKPADQAPCAGTTTTAVNFTGTPSGVTFDWTNNTQSIGLGAGSTGNIGSFTATNTGTAAVTATITVTPKANGCTGSPVTFTITVNPIPVAPSTKDHISCPAKDPTSIAWSSLITSTVTGLKWYADASGGGAIADPGNFDAATPLTKSYWVSQTVAGCESPRKEIKVSISAEPQEPGRINYDECVLVSGGSKTWASLITTPGDKVWYSADNDLAVLASEPAAFHTGTVMSLTTYYVVVKDDGGCESKRAAVTAQVKARPTAVLSGGGIICNGQTASLTVTFTGAPSFKFTYSDGTTTSSEITTAANPHTITSLTPSSTKNYSLVSLSDANCTAIASDLSGSATITVNDRPVLGALSPIAALCLGDPLTEPAKPSIDLKGSAWVSERWEIGQSGSFDPIIFPYTVNASDNGKTLRFIVVNGCGESLPAEATITVNSLPVVNITTNPAATIVLTCAVPSIMLTATGGVDYSWDNSLGNSSVATVTSAGTYTVTVTDANGCVNDGNIVIGENKTLPTAGITSDSETGILTCSAPMITLTATGGGTYLWDNGQTGANLDVTEAGDYTVTVTAANGCTDKKSITITEDGSKPTASITSDTKVLTCEKPSIELTATGGETYLWSHNSSTNTTVTVNAIGTYTVTVKAENGCTATASITITENITPPPAGIDYDTKVLTCEKSSIDLTATGGGTYLWSHNSSSDATVTVNAIGTYTVTVKAAGNGCTKTASVIITQDGDMPIASIDSETKVLTCATPKITLTASGGNAFEWADGLGDKASITVEEAGNYSVKVTTTGNGCSTTASITITASQTNPTIKVNNPEICLDNEATLMATGADTYTWTPSTGLSATTGSSVTASPTATTIYTVEGTAAATGCKGTTKATVYVEIPIALTLKAPESVELGNEITITASVDRPDHGNFEWFINDRLYKTTGEYSITLAPGAGKQHFRVATVTTGLNCPSSSETYTVEVTEFIPNIINPYSPSGINCCFMKSNELREGYRVEIYNRYMQKVFEGDDGWDGTYRGALAEPGTYFYRLYKKDGQITKGTLEVAKF